MNTGIYALGAGWVMSYRDTPCGRGEITFTPNPKFARSFDNAGEAFEYWRQQSKTVPARPDGKPNRPITAYTVEIKPIDSTPRVRF
jgi:hypothetical protein